MSVREKGKIKGNLLRITLTVFLAFGWFISGSSQAAEDPLVVAYQDIQKLNADVNNLVYKVKTQELIDIAQQRYNDAVQAKDNKDNAEQEHNDAITTEATAFEELNLAQSAVDGQTVTVNIALEDKDNALQNKNNAQDTLDIANINLQTAQSVMNNAGNQGWQFTAYYLNRFGNYAIAGPAYCSGVLTQAYQGMPICGRYENMYVVYSGKITAPEGVNQISFAGYTDDGFRMYVDGQLVIEQWVDQGSTWSPFYYHTFTPEDRTIDVVFHYFNGGGPGVFHVGWGHSGMWTGVSPSAMSYGSGATQQQINEYNQAVSEQQVAQTSYNEMNSIYNNKLSYYNTQVQTLQNLTSNLAVAGQNLTVTQESLIISIQNKENATIAYNQAILELQNAIIDARKEYEKRWQFEENQRIAAAIASALANQPQPEPTPSPIESTKPSPTPEPSVEPSPTPSPEQTKPVDPTPEPTPEKTDEPKPEPTPEPTPTPEPSPEPSPQPTDINPEPTPEPEPTPAEPSAEPSSDNNNIKELIPEKGQGTSEDLSRVIANLTSKDNVIVKLSPEQMSAVGQTLSALSTAAKVEVASSFGVKTDDINVLAQAAQSNPAVAAAIISFEEKAAENAEAPMPYTIADAITEAAAELFLQDPLAVFSGIDLEELSDPSQWGKDMTDDQREKAQEVVVPVILVSNIVASVASAISIRRI